MDEETFDSICCPYITFIHVYFTRFAFLRMILFLFLSFVCVCLCAVAICVALLRIVFECASTRLAYCEESVFRENTIHRKYCKAKKAEDEKKEGENQQHESIVFDCVTA